MACSQNQTLKFFWYLQLTTDVQDRGQGGPVGVICHVSLLPTFFHTTLQPQLCPLTGEHWETWPFLVLVSGYPHFAEGYRSLSDDVPAHLQRLNGQKREKIPLGHFKELMKVTNSSLTLKLSCE